MSNGSVFTSPFGGVASGAAGASASAIQTANYGSAGGGGFGQNLALGLGIGAMGMSAFGGTSTGGAPSAKIELTAEGKKLETGLYESIKSELFPENLASRFIGQAKKAVQVQQRASKRMIQGATGGFTGGGGGGFGGGGASGDWQISGNVARAFLTQTQAGLKGVQEGPRQVGEAKRTFALNRMAKLQNFMNLQEQVPVLRAEAELINQELAQYRGAQRGAALGGIAQLLATGYAYGGRT